MKKGSKKSKNKRINIEELPINEIIYGNCRRIIKRFPDSCIDSIITDPPYGLGFMSKKWDTFKPDYINKQFKNRGHKNPKRQGRSMYAGEYNFSLEANTEFQQWFTRWAKECLRIAKPGAFMLVFGGTRTFHRLTCAIEDAGWQIRDCLMWLYGCLSEDTEILTIEGWKHYHKTIDNDIVLCYNIEKDEFIFDKPKESFCYENKYTAYRIKSDFTDQIVSQGHCCIVEQNGDWVFQRPETWKCKKNIPFLESLQDLPETIYNKQSRTSIKKQDLLKRMPNNKSETNRPQQTRKTTQRKIESNLFCLWKKVLQKYKTHKTSNKSLLFKTMQWCSSWKRMGKIWLQRQRWLVRKNQGRLSFEKNGSRRSSMERWCNIFQEEGKLWKICYKIYSMPKKVFVNGSQRWVHNRTSIDNGQTSKMVFSKKRNSSSYRPQSNQQQSKQLNAFPNQQSSQNIRRTKASITPIEYNGKVWCVRVSTGAFVARRNGKIFITGNSGFPKSKDIGKEFDKQECRKRLIRKLGRKPTKKEFERVWKKFRKSIISPNSRKSGPSPSGCYGEGVQTKTIGKPQTKLAKLWDGYGTGLKPSWEPILVCMKPVDGNFAKNAEKWGVAGLNIDGGRIESKQGERFGGGGLNSPLRGFMAKTNKTYQKGMGFRDDTAQGRWPANVILDEEFIPILYLTNKAEIGIIQAIKEYYYDYKLPNVPKRVSDIPKQNKSNQILQQEMLLGMAKQKHKRQDSSKVRKKASSKINKKNEQNTEEKSKIRQRQSDLQRHICVEGISLHQSPRVKSDRIGNGSEDDQKECNNRTSSKNGNKIRKTIKEKRNRSSQKRNQRRQQNNKFGNNKQYKSHSKTSQTNKKTNETSQRERRLEILACDIPKKWLKYFEPTGRGIYNPNCSAKMLDKQSGELSSGKMQSVAKGGNFNTYSKQYQREVFNPSSSGGASRFFYVAKASRGERNAGCGKMEKEVGHNRFDKCGNCGGYIFQNPNRKSACKCESPIRQRNKIKGNFHPTVKPLQLMQYLCMLLKMPNKGQIILDPFVGSGTTCVACKEFGINYIGIEKDKGYCEIARARLKNVTPNLFEDKPKKKMKKKKERESFGLI